MCIYIYIYIVRGPRESTIRTSHRKSDPDKAEEPGRLATFTYAIRSSHQLLVLMQSERVIENPIRIKRKKLVDWLVSYVQSAY